MSFELHESCERMSEDKLRKQLRILSAKPKGKLKELEKTCLDTCAQKKNRKGNE